MKIAVVGAGLIGRAWSIVFARAGFTVGLWDVSPAQTQAAVAFIHERLPELAIAGLLSEGPLTVLARIMPAETLEQALEGAEHVQENGPEQVKAKQDLFARLDALTPSETILASSTSGIPASAFTEELAGRARCLVVHPVNPPYLVPLVELCPAPWTDPAVVERTRALMVRAGQAPVTVNKEVAGFALNRLQGALLAEAVRLVDDGVISPADLDTTVKHGLGLRWSFMGPFETIDLNAPGGVADYCARYSGLFATMQREMKPRRWTKALIEKLTAARRAELPANMLSIRQEWRDRRLMALLGHKASQPD